MNRDLINNANPDDVAAAAMQALDALQTHQPHAQVTGAAALFLVIADHFGLTAQDVMTVVKNLMFHTQGGQPAFRALKVYAENEL